MKRPIGFAETVMLPTFLGIGVPRAGTTWLHYLLASHTQVLMPSLRKEIHYFDQNYQRGQQWYERFFQDRSGRECKAAGEITPHYLYCAKCPQRIARMASVRRLLLMLRNPVDRAYSHFRWRVRQENYAGSFQDFLIQRPEAVDWGLYAKHLGCYLEHFDLSQILLLNHSRAFRNVPRTRERLASFLGIDPALFPPRAGASKVNPSRIPRFRRAYSAASAMGRGLRSVGLGRVVRLAVDAGAASLFGEKEDAVPCLSPQAHRQALDLFREDIRQLEDLTGEDLGDWKSA